VASVSETTKSSDGLGSLLRAEYPLLLGLTSAAFFLWIGSAALDGIANPVVLAGVFAWLFFGVLWSAISVVRHADCLALKTGEPYGTIILTLSAISIEVIMISAAVLHGANNPTLARDMMFAVVMIALNGMIGLSLLLGGLRHHEQHYNLQGASAYLNTIMALSVLGLVLPNFTTSMSGPRLSSVQEEFLIITSLVLYGIFLAMQTRGYRGYFMQAQEDGGGGEHAHQDFAMRSTGFHIAMLLLYLIAVIVMAEKFAIPLDNLTERLGMPQAFGGAIVASLVLAPEALAAIKAAMRNQLQRSVNILHGSVLASIGLTIPAVLTIGMITGRPMILGIEGGNLPLLVLTLASSIVTFGSGKTSILQGCIHLLLFGVFLLLIFCP
jgi:Ca2+:H+ antiporter